MNSVSLCLPVQNHSVSRSLTAFSPNSRDAHKINAGRRPRELPQVTHCFGELPRGLEELRADWFGQPAELLAESRIQKLRKPLEGGRHPLDELLRRGRLGRSRAPLRMTFRRRGTASV